MIRYGRFKMKSMMSVAQSLISTMYPNLYCVVANLKQNCGAIPSGSHVYLVNPDVNSSTTEIIGFQIVGGQLKQKTVSWTELDSIRVEMSASQVVAKCWRAERPEMESRIAEILEKHCPRDTSFSPDIDFSSL